MRRRMVIGGAALLALGAGAAFAAVDRPQTTPLADAQLFISPSGQPFRSKPGEPYPVVAWFAKTDADHDGKIDRAEFRAEAEDFFHQLDVRKNGIIDDEIIGLYEKKVVPEILAGVARSRFSGPMGAPRLIKVQSQLGGFGGPGGPPVTSGPDTSIPPTATDGKPLPAGAATYGLLNDPEPVRSADRSFRSRLKLADFLAQADRNFDALDADHRGYLTLEDLPRTPAQQLARPARRR